MNPRAIPPQIFTRKARASAVSYLSLILISCVWLWAAAFIDGLKWVFVGLLTAVGDTRFVMFAGSTSIWIFAIIPSYIIVVHGAFPSVTPGPALQPTTLSLPASMRTDFPEKSGKGALSLKKKRQLEHKFEKMHYPFRLIA